MAANSPATETNQGTGPHSERGVALIIALVIGVILFMAVVVQGHNTVNEGTDVPAGAYSSTAVLNDGGK